MNGNDESGVDDAVEDWRLRGQEEELAGVRLTWRRWSETREGWDHDHCEFCWQKMTDWTDEPDVRHFGYATDDEYNWVCEDCVRDFRDRFGWVVVGGPN